MTTPTTDFVQIAEQGRKAAADAIRVWTEAAQSYADSIAEVYTGPRLADLPGAVDAYFDRAGETLKAQRETATALVTATSQAVERVRALVPTVPFVPETPAR